MKFIRRNDIETVVVLSKREAENYNKDTVLLLEDDRQLRVEKDDNWKIKLNDKEIDIEVRLLNNEPLFTADIIIDKHKQIKTQRARALNKYDIYRALISTE